MIEIQNLYKTFNKVQVLNGLNLSVREGETKVVIGRSGVGKSVLLKNIVGIMKPDSGSIRIKGVELTQMPDKEYDKVRKSIGFVFQGGALFDSLNVAENVGFFLDEFMKLPPAQKRMRIAHALSLVRLKNVEEMMPSQLSGGMRKRVSLARVLCMEPRIIFYDEPTTGLDPVTADAINNMIIEMRDKLKVTSIVVTHDMTSAYKVADSIAMIYHGQVIADGTPDVIRTSHHPVVRQFVNGESDGPITEDESMKYGHVK
ncbi:MAG: ATP-binding cassette domain-containing protein [Candidatus Omnitrophica bacterium]|nr:ATP-binding cassette domain-containing protein [Candidatus Omnitrophota bacterium]